MNLDPEAAQGYSSDPLHARKVLEETVERLSRKPVPEKLASTLSEAARIVAGESDGNARLKAFMDLERHAESIENLGNSGDEIVKLLSQTVGTSLDSETGNRSIRLLERIGEFAAPEALGALISGFYNSTKPATREFILRALGKVAQDAKWALVGLGDALRGSGIRLAQPEPERDARIYAGIGVRFKRFMESGQRAVSLENYSDSGESRENWGRLARIFCTKKEDIRLFAVRELADADLTDLEGITRARVVQSLVMYSVMSEKRFSGVALTDRVQGAVVALLREKAPGAFSALKPLMDLEKEQLVEALKKICESTYDM